MMSRYKSDRPEFLSTEGEVPDSGSASGPRMDEGQGQEQGDPALGLYLKLIRHAPVLSRDETAVLAHRVADGEARFRASMNRIPAVAFRLLSLWDERKEAGRNTGLLAHGYHGDVKHDWAADIDRAMRRLVKALAAQGLDSLEDVGPDEVEVADRGVALLDECPILLEHYIDVHRDLKEAQDVGKAKDRRLRLAEIGMADPSSLRHLAQATEALEEREQVRQEFAFHNLKLVVKVAKRFRGTGLPFLDLIQEGNLGLMRAVEKFDPSLGFAFSTYAVWWIEQSIIRSVQNQSRTIRTPSHIFQQRRDFETASQRLRALRGDEPDAVDLGEALSMETEEVERVTAALMPIQSLDLPVSEDGMVSAGDLLEAEEGPEMGGAHDQVRVASSISQGLRSLPERERDILEMRFGLRDGEELTLRETGERMGISRERVRQIQAQALSRLRQLAEVDSLASYVEACSDAA